MADSESTRLPISILIIAVIGLGLVSASAPPTILDAPNLSFTSALNLSKNPASCPLTCASLPLVATSGSHAYVTWLNDSSRNSNLLFASSNNNGTSFGPVVKITNSTTQNAAQEEIVAVGSDVYVVWQQNVSSTSVSILFRASTNNGTSFGPIITVATSGGSCGHSCTITNLVSPGIAAVGSNVYVVWLATNNGATTNEVFFKASATNGSNLASVAQQTLSSSAYGSAQPQVAAVTAFVYVTWTDMAGSTFFSASSNSGTSFAFVAAHALGSLGSGETDLYQNMVAVGADVYLSWTNDTVNTDNTMVVASTNNGQNFGTVLNMNKGVVTDLYPELAASGTNVYLVWSDAPGNGNTEVLYRASTNNGATFGTVLNMSRVNGLSNQQAIAASGSSLYISWVQNSPAGSGVYFVSSSNNGSTFSSPQNLSSDALSVNPFVIGSGSYAYIAWEDDTTGNGDVYFERGGPALPPTVVSESFGTNENQTQTLTLSGNDPGGLPLTFSIVAGPSHGTLGPVTSTGPNSAQVTYTPNPNYTGSDSFTYKAVDGTQASSTGTVSLIVYMSSASGGGGGGSRPFAK